MKLGVNVDHVATLRQVRRGNYSDPVEAALLCQKAGAHAIVMHLREDRRHVQDQDLFRAREELTVKLNMEMSIDPQIIRVACKVLPDQCTLVPEKRREMTTEGGLDLLANRSKLQGALDILIAKKIDISLFIAPDLKQVEEAKKLGVRAVEFHTGDYANQTTLAGAKRELERLEKAVTMANNLGLQAHAGHGLDYQNVKALRKIQGLDELNIGYSIICKSVWVGLDEAVKQMLRLIS